MAAQVTPNLVIFIKSVSLSNCFAIPVSGKGFLLTVGEARSGEPLIQQGDALQIALTLALAAVQAAMRLLHRLLFT